MAESSQTARAVAWPRVNGRPAPFSFRIDEVSTKKKGGGGVGGGGGRGDSNTFGNPGGPKCRSTSLQPFRCPF